MEQRKLRPVVSLGMFDFFKGIGIISVIFAHTLSDFNVGFTDTWYACILAYFSIFVMGCFFIAFGFTLRKRDIKKCTKQIKKTIVTPYILTGIVAVLLSIMVRFVIFHQTRDAIRRGFDVFMSLLCGFRITVTIGSFQIESCGTMWFFLAIAGGWFMMNLILQMKEKHHQYIALLIINIIYGVLSMLPFQLPFCFVSMLQCVFYLYFAVLAKENKWFEKPLSFAGVAVCVFSLVLFLLNLLNALPSFINASPFLSNVFGYFIAPIARIIACYAILYVAVHINRRENFIVNILEKLGHQTMYILCLHVIEAISIPWYYFTSNIPNRVLSFAVTLLLRSLFIALGLLVIRKFQDFGGFDHIRKILAKKTTA